MFFAKLILLGFLVRILFLELLRKKLDECVSDAWRWQVKWRQKQSKAQKKETFFSRLIFSWFYFFRLYSLRDSLPFSSLSESSFLFLKEDTEWEEKALLSRKSPVTTTTTTTTTSTTVVFDESASVTNNSIFYSSVLEMPLSFLSLFL